MSTARRGRAPGERRALLPRVIAGVEDGMRHAGIQSQGPARRHLLRRPRSRRRRDREVGGVDVRVVAVGERTMLDPGRRSRGRSRRRRALDERVRRGAPAGAVDQRAGRVANADGASRRREARSRRPDRPASPRRTRCRRGGRTRPARASCRSGSWRASCPTCRLPSGRRPSSRRCPPAAEPVLTSSTNSSAAEPDVPVWISLTRIEAAPPVGVVVGRRRGRVARQLS